MEDITLLNDFCPQMQYLHDVRVNCKRCGKPVIISPNNATFVNAEMGNVVIKRDGMFDVSRIAKCHSCGYENHIRRFLKKSSIKQSIGQLDLNAKD